MSEPAPSQVSELVHSEASQPVYSEASQPARSEAGGGARSGASRPARATALGVAAAAVTITAAAVLGEERGLELLAALLAFAAAVYVGAGLRGPSRTRARLEWAVALGFTATALAGLWIAPVFLAAGWIGHGAWDWSHHRRGGPEGARWYPSTCLAYDWGVGGYLVFLLIA